MCKVHTNSHYVNTGKTVTADLTTNYAAETNTSLAEKFKNVRKQNINSEGGANNSELDNDTDKSNLNSKVKYLA